jgi:hypothetical protein
MKTALQRMAQMMQDGGLHAGKVQIRFPERQMANLLSV